MVKVVVADITGEFTKVYEVPEEVYRQAAKLKASGRETVAAELIAQKGRKILDVEEVFFVGV